MAMGVKGRTSTEVSGITAISVAVSLLMQGMYMAAAVAFLIGVGLLIAYEYLGIEKLRYSEAEIEETAEDAGERAEKKLDSFQG